MVTGELFDGCGDVEVKQHLPRIICAAKGPIATSAVDAAAFCAPQHRRTDQRATVEFSVAAASF